jgi:hypothetical protein
MKSAGGRLRLKCDGTRADFVFRRNGRVNLNRQGRQFGRLLTAELHSPFSPSLPLRCVTVCRHISTGLYSTLQYRNSNRDDRV